MDRLLSNRIRATAIARWRFSFFENSRIRVRIISISADSRSCVLSKLDNRATATSSWRKLFVANNLTTAIARCPVVRLRRARWAVFRGPALAIFAHHANRLVNFPIWES
jgi:hypothetical protein